MASFWAAQASAEQPLLVQLGDTHYHSGYSGDNRSDAPPEAAFRKAKVRLRSNPGVGGYFLFMTDHIQYTRTRPDMTEATFQQARVQADSSEFDVRSAPTLTVFAGAELTGLRRARSGHPYWDDKFGHLNLLNPTSIADFVENSLSSNYDGQAAMDRYASVEGHLGQFNHPGFGEEPRTGDSENHLYPYSAQRDRTFRLIEVSNGSVSSWDKGMSQYNLCLQQGYHVSPAMGSDFHDTRNVFSWNGCAWWTPPTSGKTLMQRRALLLEAVAQGRCYVTEDVHLRIFWSLDGRPMGSQLEPRKQAQLQLKVEQMGGLPIRWVELLADAPSPRQASQESQVTRVLAHWDVEGPLCSQAQTVDCDGLKYLYVRAQTKDGRRAASAPITFY
jgi:hypothetical protein